MSYQLTGNLREKSPELADSSLHSVRRGESRFGFDRIVHTQKTSLQLAPGVPLESWKRVGQQIHRIADSSCWWFGDWLVYGEKSYPGRYREAIEQTNLDYQTLRNYAWVARAFELSRRRDSLSFQHHAEVAALPEEQQEVWLNRAAEFRWSRRRLREELKAERTGPNTGSALATVQVSIEGSRHRRWLDAADALELSLREWMEFTLDEAAGSILGAEKVTGTS